MGTGSLTAVSIPYDHNIIGKDVPMYPVLDESNREMYKKYKQEADKYNNIIFVGRLAEYMYYDMDAVVEKALYTFENLRRCVL